MWINLTKEIFEKADFKSLNYLYQILSWYPNDSSIRYNIVVDTQKVADTDNFKKLSAIEKSLEAFLDLEYTEFVTSQSTISYKIAQKKAPSHFNIEEAILFFNQPVSIILENNKNDSQFIRAVLTCFGSVDGINKAAEHLNNGWLQFENAGGCSNIPNFMEGFLERFKKIADKNNRQISDYFRGIIIIDSDKEYENQGFKHKALLGKLELLGLDTSKVILMDEATKIETFKNEHPNIHILKKRMMENYLPKVVFEEIQRQRAVQQNADLKAWLETYLTLNDTQLDYINISDGFPPKKDKKDRNGSRKPVDNAILTLFSLSLEDENFKKLDNGFNFQGFDEKGNLKTGSGFKTEFPNLFKKPIINKQNLEIRDGEAKELQQITNKITNLL